jgi:Domain of unknown function (DUF4062)
MADNFTSYRAFVASPSDVAPERDLAEGVIHRVNLAIRDTSAGIHLAVRRWEHRPAVIDSRESFQDELDREARQAGFFIFILGDRYGTVSQGHVVSNTEREFDTAIRAQQSNPKLKILAYLREVRARGSSERNKRQEKFRSKVRRCVPTAKTYKTPEEFRNTLTHDIYELVLRLRLSPFKQESLRSFWQLGETESVPKLAVLYPPVDRGDLQGGGDKNFWLRRLLTQLAVEDYRSIQAIENGLRLIGYTSYQIYPHTNAPLDLESMNRAWLCLPRNTLGLRFLGKYQSPRFNYSPNQRTRRTMSWKSPKGDTIEVQSPMAAYMYVQRRKMDVSSEWSGQLERITAKDYAILARKRAVVAKGTDSEPLYDYFFAGIRGLGTWGAAWFVDKNYRTFRDCDPSADIEMLLEVTYRDGDVRAVRDVSSEPQSYFVEQNSTDAINRAIREQY